MFRISRLLPAALLASLVIVGATATSASAHDALVGSVPKADSIVSESLTTVSVTFAETPVTAFSSSLALRVLDPDGKPVTQGAVKPNGSTLSIAVEPTKAGKYEVTWQSVSSDGHPVSGTFNFTYAGPVATPTATATPTAESTPTMTLHASEPAKSSAASESSTTNQGGLGFLLIIGGTLVILAALVFFLVRFRGTPPKA